MDNELKTAKMEMKNQMRPSRTYGYYASIPILSIIITILSFLGINLNAVGGVIFIFTIMANVEAVKLPLISKRKYIAPFLVYFINLLTIFLFPILLSNSVSGDTAIGLIALIIFPIQIVAYVFFFLTASEIKKKFPTMKEDALNARTNYLNLKKSIK